jgi:rRNA processing protein Krr1/Pno1
LQVKKKKETQHKVEKEKEMKINEILKEGDVIPFKKPDSDLKKALDTYGKDRDQQRARDMIRLAPDVVDYYKELVAQGYSYEEAVELIADDNDMEEYDIKRMLQAAGKKKK